ncbi:hypothetical protein BYT27DRAFT_7106461 [Phlegmacium glaucopus]|nr:hypothetical protein BYT27DRAFT_7106461 [Phlegmacium glaucopus]
MARRPKHLKKSGKLQVDALQQKCRYCKTHRGARGFDKHEAWCKKTWMIRKELRDVKCEHAIINQLQVEVTPPLSPTIPPCCVDFSANNEFVEGSSSVPMEVDHPPLESDPREPTTVPNHDEPAVTFGPHLPPEYIKIIPHPHSPNPSTKIIALNTWNPACQSLYPTYMPQPEPRPWAPFENLADFEYTETAVLGLLPKWIINKQLTGFNSNWADGSHLTIKNFTEMDKVLSKARKYFVQFKQDTVTATYQGKVSEFTFEYRDPWEWILSVVQDESLAPMAMWNAVRKYYCKGDFEERLYDEPNTADTWWNVDVSLHISAKYAILIFFPQVRASIL